MVAREVQRSFSTKAYGDEKPSCIKTRTLITIQEDNIRIRVIQATRIEDRQVQDEREDEKEGGCIGGRRKDSSHRNKKEVQSHHKKPHHQRDRESYRTSKEESVINTKRKID